MPSCKRLKLMEPDQQRIEEETTQPAPLGLTLSTTPSFLDHIEMKPSQGQPPMSDTKQNLKHEIVMNKIANTPLITPSAEKMKASNFFATFLKIGSWERTSRYDGDLVAKCYFAKRKLIWEILEDGLKSKIEIQWSDIASLRATYHANEPDLLEIELSRAPHFFHETNPQPKKHTLWQEAYDFTGGQAIMHRRHLVQFAEGTLKKHYEKLLQYDSRLRKLSETNFPSLISPYFESGDEKHQEHGGLLFHGLPQNSTISYGFSQISNEIYHPPAQVYAATPTVNTLHNQGGFYHVRPAFHFDTTLPSSVMDCLSTKDGINHFDDTYMGGSLCYDKPAHGNIHDAFQRTYSNVSRNIQLANQDNNFLQGHEIVYNPFFPASGTSGFSENQAVLENTNRDLLCDPFVFKCCDNQNQQNIARMGSPCCFTDAAETSMNAHQEDDLELVNSQVATRTFVNSRMGNSNFRRS